MPRLLVLEDFSPAAPAPLAREHNEGIAEEQRLSAFEQGYKAGWDDAVNSTNEDQSQITADLASQLRDLSFGFHEARSHVLAGVSDLVRSVMGSLVPKIGADLLPELVAQHLQSLMEQSADAPIKLRVAPESRRAVEAALPTDPGFPLTIEESSEFAAGQVAFVMGDCESELNLEECFERIEREVASFFTENERQLAHG